MCSLPGLLGWLRIKGDKTDEARDRLWQSLSVPKKAGLKPNAC
jgi:hypothetical protein